MYHAFYQLHTDPFRLTPDPALSFQHQSSAHAVAYLPSALRQGEGFIMVTGLPGTGKTTLIEQFHSELNGTRTLVAKLTSTQLQADELLRLICLSLGVTIQAQDKAGMLHQLRQFFVAQANKGRRTLLLIDEAQDLPVSALEELRLLGNLQLNARPLLQIFLVGQEQLLEMVRAAPMRPLYQRLVAACHLEPLSFDETRAYIEYRLERAGWNGEPVFDARSYHMIHRFSEGFPRQINKVCSRLLLYGSTEKKRQLDCFDCLKVLKHWLEELPGSTSESSFKACVDMLNAAWSEAEGAAAGQTAGAAALQPSLLRPDPPTEIRFLVDINVARGFSEINRIDQLRIAAGAEDARASGVRDWQTVASSNWSAPAGAAMPIEAIGSAWVQPKAHTRKAAAMTPMLPRVSSRRP